MRDHLQAVECAGEDAAPGRYTGDAPRKGAEKAASAIRKSEPQGAGVNSFYKSLRKQVGK